MLKRNDRIEIEILRYGSNGEGVGVCDGQTVFVPFTIAGEVVLCHIIFAKKNFAIGKLVEIVKKSQARKEPVCEIFGKCGGCQMQHIAYETQLEIKKNDVVQTFKKVANIEIEEMQIHASPKTIGYRNKLSMPFAKNGSGVVCGFYQSGTHNIVQAETCPLQTEKGNVALDLIIRHVKKYKIEGYDEKDKVFKSGVLRHAVIRAVKEGVIVVLVATSGSLASLDVLYESLKREFGKVSLYVNVNREKTNVIFGDKFIHKFGEKTLKAEKQGIFFDIGAESFLQVNDQVVDMLYAKAVEYANAKDGDVVVNCYSGAGFLSAMFAKNASEVVGIEIVAEASELADVLAKENGLASIMQNITGDVEEQFPRVMGKIKSESKNAVLVFDPPRKGCDSATLALAKKHKPNKIVYVSCNPQTLARDVGILQGSLVWEENSAEGGAKTLKKAVEYTPQYKITNISAYDMFPQTNHVETVVCLELA